MGMIKIKIIDQGSTESRPTMRPQGPAPPWPMFEVQTFGHFTSGATKLIVSDYRYFFNGKKA
jgi:hypothetical protein